MLLFKCEKCCNMIICLQKCTEVIQQGKERLDVAGEKGNTASVMSWVGWWWGKHSWRSHLETWCAQPIHCNRSKDWLKGSRPRRVLHWMMDACGTSLLIAPVLFACPVAAFPFLCSCFCTVCQCLHGQGLAGLWHASCELDAQIRPLVNNCMGTLKMKWTSRLGGSELPSWWLTHKLVERLSLEIG